MMDLLKSPTVQGFAALIVLLLGYAVYKLYLSFYHDLPPGPDRTRLAVSLTLSTIRNARRTVRNEPAPPPQKRGSNPKFSGTISEPIAPPFTHSKDEGDE